MVKTDKKIWEEKQVLEDKIRGKIRDKENYIKLLQEYPVPKIINPLEELPTRKILTGCALDQVLSANGGVEAGSSIEAYGEFACHSEDTQVLTPDGIKDWDDVEIGDYVYGKDVNNNIVKTMVNDIFVYDYDDYLYHFDNNRFSLLVTPNHDIFYRKSKDIPFSKNRADKVYNKKSGYILCSFDWSGEYKQSFNIYDYISPVERSTYHRNSQMKPELDEFDTRLFMLLVGLYIAEGSQFKTEGGVYVQIKNSTYVPEISEILNELNLDYSIYENNKFVIFHQDLAKYLLRCGDGAPNKKIPDELLELDKQYLYNLFRGLMLGDGHKNGYNYYTCSVKLRDQFLVLCLKLGFNPSFRLKGEAGRISYINDREIRSKHDYYYINIAYNPSGYFDERQDIQSKVKYKGKVWCYSTDTVNFFTVRNGQPTISGNTGKTMFAQTVCAEAEGYIVYIDNEHTFRGNRFAEICSLRGRDPEEVNKRLMYFKPANWIEQEATVRQLPEFDPDTEEFLDIGAVIVDSIMCHWADSRDWQGRENLPQRQSLIRAELLDLRNYCRRHNAVLFYTNQVYMKPVANPYASVEDIYIPRGGASIAHIGDYRILLRKGPRNLRYARLVDALDLPLMEVPFVLHKSGVANIEDEGEQIRAIEQGEKYGLKFLDTKVFSANPAKKYYAKAFLLGILKEEKALEQGWLNEKDIEELKQEKIEIELERAEKKSMKNKDEMTDEERDRIAEAQAEEEL
jgi:RecA/RadA recombinase